MLYIMPVYTCPQCEYNAPHEAAIRSHFARKYPCKSKDGLVLTPEIKEEVLRNRKYSPPTTESTTTTVEPTQPTVRTKRATKTTKQETEPTTATVRTKRVTKTTNTAPTDSAVTTTDTAAPVTRAKRVINTTSTPAPVPARVETPATTILSRVSDSMPSRIEDTARFIRHIINSHAKGGDSGDDKSDEETNNPDDSESRRLGNMMIEDLKKHLFWMDVGVVKVMEIIQEHCLDTYELFLIKKMYDQDILSEKGGISYAEHLKNYYKFICNFELTAYVWKTDDPELKELQETIRMYLDYQYQIDFDKIKENVDPAEKIYLRNHLVKVVRDREISITREVLDLIKVEETFKQKLFATE